MLWFYLLVCEAQRNRCLVTLSPQKTFFNQTILTQMDKAILLVVLTALSVTNKWYYYKFYKEVEYAITVQ